MEEGGLSIRHLVFGLIWFSNYAVFNIEQVNIFTLLGTQRRTKRGTRTCVSNGQRLYFSQK